VRSTNLAMGRWPREDDEGVTSPCEEADEEGEREEWEEEVEMDGEGGDVMD